MAKKTIKAHPLLGMAAPRFTLPASGGGKVKLADYRGRRPVVLFFYSKDLTES
jgi:peroxiredoxin Q/BCP